MAAGNGLIQLLVLSVCALLTTDAQFSEETPSGTLVVGGMQVTVDISTRVGCRELIRCVGNGTSLEWRRFSLRGVLMSDGNRVVDTTMTDPDMDQFYSFISHLEFNPIRLTDTGSFTCTIGSMGTHTARLRVEPDLAEVITTDHDISTRSVGDMMSVSCAVASCVPDLTIQLLRGDLVQETRSLQQSEGSEFTSQEDGFAVTVDPSIVGEYSCRVVGTFMGETFAFSESFNITGTPQPRPTLQVPTIRSAADRVHVSLAVILLALLTLSTALSHQAVHMPAM